MYLADMQDRPNLSDVYLNVYIADMQDRPNMSDMNNVYLEDMQLSDATVAAMVPTITEIAIRATTVTVTHSNSNTRCSHSNDIFAVWP